MELNKQKKGVTVIKLVRRHTRSNKSFHKTDSSKKDIVQLMIRTAASLKLPAQDLNKQYRPKASACRREIQSMSHLYNIKYGRGCVGIK